MKLLIKGGRVINPATKLDEVTDILLEDGIVKEIKNDIKADDAEVYDATGKVVAPGLVDIHVHFREPGQEAKEDFLSGSMAAAAGGFTTVCTMPNTKPVVDSAALVRSLEKRAEDVAKVNVKIIGAVTKNQEGKELAELGDMIEAGAVAFSDDGHFDPSAKVMLNAFDYLHTFDKVIVNHEEEPTLVEDGVMNEGHRSAMLGMKGRPTVAEDIAVARDILLAEYAGARVHIAHVSTARSVDLIREAKKRGVRVTAEATPHHLTLTDECVNLYDSSTKVNPPLRSKNDCEAIVEGLKDGTIDAVVTDHSPHAQEDKDREYVYAASGFPGLETSLGIMLTDFYHTKKLDLPLIISKMSYEPAKVFGMDCGDISVGKKADIAVIDTEAKWTVDDKKFYTRGSHSPFVGRNLQGKAVLTVVNGNIVMRDGEIV